MTKPDDIITGTIGVVGTSLAAIMRPETAAIFAGVGTGAWMFWQLATSIFDRIRKTRTNTKK